MFAEWGEFIFQAFRSLRVDPLFWRAKTRVHRPAGFSDDFPSVLVPDSVWITEIISVPPR